MDFLLGVLIIFGIPTLFIFIIIDNKRSTKKLLEKREKRIAEKQEKRIVENEDSVYAKKFGKGEFLEFKATKFPSKYLYPKKDLEDNGHLFYKKKVVITGGFENYPFRESIAQQLWELGADVDTTIGKKTDFALVGSYNVGSKKMEKIFNQNIKIIREPELIRLLNEK